MEAYQILHIPTGEYLTSKNRNGEPVLVSDIESANKLIQSIINHVSYCNGAPISDFYIQQYDSITLNYIEEFDTIKITTLATNPKPRILSIS